MKALFRVFRRVWRGRFGALAIGILLSIAVLGAGLALLGLSGWFITAAGMAGLAGAGLTFDVFRPSAGVRFLALGRAAARYGERLATHDATLKGLAELRVALLTAMLQKPVVLLARLRGSERLNHLTIDVDALDGVALRLVMPAIAATLVLAAALALIGWLVLPSVALWEVGSYVCGLGAALAFAARFSRQPSRFAQRAMQALRMRFIDMMRGQTELAVAGRLEDHCQKVLDAHRRLQGAQARIDAVERVTAILLGLAGTIAAGGGLLIGGLAAASGKIDPASAALGFFAALALVETAAPLARGIAELGKMTDAARRIEAQFDDPASPVPRNSVPASPLPTDPPLLDVEGLACRQRDRVLFQDVAFSISAGETLALVGPSGSGKTTLLNVVRGLMMPAQGSVTIAGRSVAALGEAERAACIGYLPQRTALVSGTIADNLRIADPAASEEMLWRNLKIACLDEVVVERGGLDCPLGEAGLGLSGGERRRLALARMLLRRPRIILLDEPTEGLDADTARMLLERLRAGFPEAAILVAAHRDEERAWANGEIAIGHR
ncbi:MAG: thiol reductant ABC exporter subunit CydC [Rhizobium sp.]|nr:thiol reductant ABC exporter subunit CydC [Rhizobium sp.]